MKKEHFEVIKSIFDKMVRYRCCNVSAAQGDLTKIEYKESKIKRSSN
mgnify:CR=1 FL=1